MYDDRARPNERGPVGLAPSTVWRWLSWLGEMTDTLRAAWGLIREKEPNSTLHRQLHRVVQAVVVVVAGCPSHVTHPFGVG